MKGRFRRAWPALILVVGLLVAIAAGGAAATDTTASAPIAELTADHNDSDRPLHEDPAVATGDGDTGAVADWLASALGGSATDSAVALSDSQFELAKETLGDDYDEWHELYDALAADTGREGTDPDRTRDEQAAEAFAEIQTEQTELATLAEEFESTRTDYEAARQRGDDDAARAHARELVALEEEIEATGGSLEEHYTNLEAFTGIDFNEALTSINETTTAANADAAEAAGESFLATTIELESTDESIGFENPLTVDGRLTDENGNAVADAAIALPTPDGVEQTTTDNTGHFELHYRPVALTVDTEELTVEHRPDSAGQYMASTTTIDTDVTQTTATLDAALPANAASGDEIEATLTATVDEEPVSGLPVVVTIGDTSVETSTDDTGSATSLLTVPSDLTTETTPVEFATTDGLAVKAEPIERELALNTESGVTGFGNGGIGLDTDNSLTTIGIAFATALTLVTVAAVIYRRRRSSHVEPAVETPPAPVTPAGTEESDGLGKPTEPEPRSVLEQARAKLPGSPNRAATLAYGHARGALSNGEDADTHWEFYRTSTANGLDDETVQALKTVTESYELAAFTPDGTDPDGATEAIEAAERIDAG